MIGLCYGSLALLAGVLGIFGLSWYRGRQNGGKPKQIKKNANEIKEIIN